MTNPDNVGGLSAGYKQWESAADKATAIGLRLGSHQWWEFIRAELCRAAPAGGVRVDGEMFICYLIDKCERETISEESLHEWLADFLKSPRYHRPSAPAGSGEVDDAVGILEMVLDGRISGRISEWPQLKPAIAALLRKLQQGAE